MLAPEKGDAVPYKMIPITHRVKAVTEDYTMTVTSPLEDELEVSATPWSLVACSSWLSGQEFEIKSKHNSNLIKVGRGSHCDIIFPGTHLSREHIELRIEANHIYVKDLGSANGTFINEVRINEGVVRPGDKLRLDVYSFKVVGPVPEPEPALNAADALDINATKLRSVDAEPVAPTMADEVESEKQWVSKPTSPGNRIDTPADEKSSLLPLYIIAGTLMVAVGLLGAYLFLN